MTGTTPMGSFGFSPALLGQSPAALFAKHRSPAPSGSFSSPGMLAALGVDLRSGNLNIGGSMGTPQMPRLPPDENKKRELAEILKLLGSRPGRISEAAVERLAKGMGLDCYKETMAKVTTLSLAAKIFLLDIEFVDGKVQRVQLSFEKTAGPSGDLAPHAATIFHKNLCPELVSTKRTPPGRTSILTPPLTDFAENLNRLYRTDKLSSTSLNCFTAITGIYQSLHKIYEYERDNAGGEIAAICFGNGRPRMHTRGKVGLSIDYWKERRTVVSKRAGGDDGDCEVSESVDDGDDEHQRLWRVLIEVEETSQDFRNMNINNITPVRASNHWVSDEVKRPKEDNLFGDVEEFVTDWLEPPLEELMDMSGEIPQSRPPSARFLACLDPPICLPLQDEMEIRPGLMLTDDISTLEKLLCPSLPPSGYIYRRLFIPDNNTDSVPSSSNIVHKYHFHSHLKPVYARNFSEIPFSHPKDLFNIFRTLRQFALMTTLLESCFSSPASFTVPHPSTTSDNTKNDQEYDLGEFFDDDDNSYTGSSLLTPPPTSTFTGTENQEIIPVDILLEPEQAFGIRIVFSTKSLGTVNLQIQVGRNAELKVMFLASGCDGDGGETDPGCAGESKGKENPMVNIDAVAIEKALKSCEDLGVVLEWIRRR